MNRDEDADVRVSAALALCRIDQGNRDALQALVDHFEDDDERGNPVEAALALAQLGTQAKPTLPSLYDVINRGDADLQVLGLSIIGPIGGADAVPLMADQLKNGSIRVRTAAAEALGEMGAVAAPAVFDLIDALFNEFDAMHSVDDFEYAALTALGKIGPVAVNSIPSLQILEKSSDDDYYDELVNRAIARIQRIE